MKIGEVSKRLDTPASAIRYYEIKGLIKPPIRVSGKREFSESALIILRFIQLSQAAGFTIAEIHQILEQHMQDSSQGGLWLPAVKKKQSDIRNKIKELIKQMETVLDELMECRCKSIEQCATSALKNSRWELGIDECSCYSMVWSVLSHPYSCLLLTGKPRPDLRRVFRTSMSAVRNLRAIARCISVFVR